MLPSARLRSIPTGKEQIGSNGPRFWMPVIVPIGLGLSPLGLTGGWGAR